MLSLSCTPSFSFMTHVSFLGSNLLPSPRPPPPSLACNLSTVHSLVPPRIAHHRSLLHLLTPSERLTSLCLSTCDLLFLISDFLSDWQITITLEDLHKSLPSHFQAEMAFLPICTVSDHIEHPVHTALIPIFSTKRRGDVESEEVSSPLKDGVFVSSRLCRNCLLLWFWLWKVTELFSAQQKKKKRKMKCERCSMQTVTCRSLPACVPSPDNSGVRVGTHMCTYTVWYRVISAEVLLPAV